MSLAVLLSPAHAWAHDASAYGGVFRSRNAGATWLNADTGLFLNSALTVAVDPRDSADLLLGTDTGLLRSHNAGRSWTPEGKEIVLGAVFAAAFAPDGRSILCSAPGGVFRFGDAHWERAHIAAGGVPARAIAFGARPGRVYLLGREGLFASEDSGRNFALISDGFGGKVSALAVAAAPEETVFVLANGALLASVDEGSHWERRGPEAATLDAVFVDPATPHRIWVVERDAFWVSDDMGRRWHEAARLPDPGLSVRGIAADLDATNLIVTTDHGMYRSLDAGRTWQLEESSLPVHLEAGPLTRDPGDARIVYAVFSLMPYAEAWRAAVESETLLSRVDRTQVLGGIAFMLLLLLSGGTLVHRLARLRAFQS